jgi:hypothetical protein
MCVHDASFDPSSSCLCQLRHSSAAIINSVVFSYWQLKVGLEIRQDSLKAGANASTARQPAH